MSTIWTVFYTSPSRYNWMFQYYLRREGLALSWVGTGRLIFSLNYAARGFRGGGGAVRRRGRGHGAGRLVVAGDRRAASRRTSIKRQVLNEMLYHGVSRLLGARSPAA